MKFLRTILAGLLALSLVSAASFAQSGGAVGGAVGAMTNLGCLTGNGTSNTFSFTSISQAYNSLEIRLVGNSSNASTSDGVAIRFNNDSGANYWATQLQGTGTAAQANPQINATSVNISEIPAASFSATNGGVGFIEIPGYSQSTLQKSFNTMSYHRNGTGSSSNSFQQTFGGTWASTAAITRVDLILNGNWITGSKACLYGIN